MRQYQKESEEKIMLESKAEVTSALFGFSFINSQYSIIYSPLDKKRKVSILILDFIVVSCDKVSFSFIELEKNMLDAHVKSDNTLEMYGSQRKKQFKSLQ